MTGNISTFFQPISQRDKLTLIRNYLLNNGDNIERALPDCLRDILEQNPKLKMSDNKVKVLENLMEWINT